MENRHNDGKKQPPKANTAMNGLVTVTREVPWHKNMSWRIWTAMYLAMFPSHLMTTKQDASLAKQVSYAMPFLLKRRSAGQAPTHRSTLWLEDCGGSGEKNGSTPEHRSARWRGDGQGVTNTARLTWPDENGGSTIERAAESKKG